ncbi:MAG: hypothetical protein HQ471_07385 [Flavobacteriales bacterium]|nr:hypothetical protein [Flavobacteriales bacterium]
MPFTANDIIIKLLTHQNIVWFKASNTYVIVEKPVSALLLQINQNKSANELLNWCQQTLKINKDQCSMLIGKTTALYTQQTTLKATKPIVNIQKALKQFQVIYYYKIARVIFKVSFENEALAFLIHPKFAHLCVAEADFDFDFKVYFNNQDIVLEVDKLVIGTWQKSEIEYFQGKFSMCLIEKLYGKPESEWLGVFHASALSDGKNSILFTGDSGNGKSTLAALLMAKGWDLLADDFAPMASKNKQLYYFPAAISIKESAVSALSEYFPQLKNTTQHHFKNQNKKVRYLAPTPTHKNQVERQPCKALVFVKYDKKIDLKCEKITQEMAFQQLIPDAWLSPETNNAKQFLDWFTTMPCYQLSYSDNALMCQTVDKLFNDDL